MQILINILENIGIMVLTIVLLLGGGWLLLLILHWGLKIKTGSREQDGLMDLWESAMARKPPADEEESQSQKID